jgi:hypothetical protein
MTFPGVQPQLVLPKIMSQGRLCMKEARISLPSLAKGSLPGRLGYWYMTRIEFRGRCVTIDKFGGLKIMIKRKYIKPRMKKLGLLRLVTHLSF